jgi:hypothetical protein
LESTDPVIQTDTKMTQVLTPDQLDAQAGAIQGVPPYVVQALNVMLLRCWSKQKQEAFVSIEDLANEIQKQPAFVSEWKSHPCPDLILWLKSVPALVQSRGYRVEVFDQRLYRFSRELFYLGTMQNPLQYN